MALSTADAAHLIRRTGFGVTPALLDELTGLDLVDAVDRVLDVSLAPAAPDPAFITDESIDQWERWYRLVWWWMDRMRTSPVPVVEKMTLFWHGHFVSGQDKLFDIVLLHRQNQLFRTHALGDHRVLCQAMAVDPAMLQYLDNGFNVAGREQENFARELMELFTMGVGNYTEADVVSMARAWTGHNLDDADWRTYRYYAARHDAGTKTLFGISRAWNGPETIDEILTGSKRDVAARFIAKKLWSFFAYPNPTADLVAALGDAFVASGLDLHSLVRTILLRPEFFSATARNGLVRSPTELLVAGMQALGRTPAQAHPEWWMEGMGQQLYYPPNVAGWKQNSYWISTAAFWSRASWAGYVRWQAAEAGVFANIHTSTASAAIQHAFDTFGITEPSPATRSRLEAWFTARNTPSTRWELPSGLVLLMLLTPDFQLA